MSDQIISSANLSYIESNLNQIARSLDGVHQGVDVVYSTVTDVDQNVQVVTKEIASLAKDFNDFVLIQVRANRKLQAQQQLGLIRQELDSKYGHCAAIRKATTGILQADDLGIIKKETITNTTEELMLSAPGYWLAPCLVALAAWINDQPELAERALKEGIRRNDEKTSLLFALLCRRADRKSACLKWTQRYLANQNEEDLDRKAIIVLDAYASGLLGADSEGVISRQITQWLDHLEEKPGFIEQQASQWSDAINLQRMPIENDHYPYLKKYSKTWPILQDIMEGAELHHRIFDYFSNIFEQETQTGTVKEQLDGILTSLVADFDDEELPLRKKERFEQMVYDFEGDEPRARHNMAIEETAFETHKDFTQLLTDAAMKPESSHASVSTQKFALALSKEWISNAYHDVIAQNRMKIPNDIEIKVTTFNDSTTDGKNEAELVRNFEAQVSQETEAALLQYKLSGFDLFCLYGGGAIGAMGLVMCLANPFLGIIAIISGVGLVIRHFSIKKKIEENIENVKAKFEDKQNKGVKIIRALMAEVVDFRESFQEKDSESQKVIDFLEQISPEQYIKNLADSTRRIKVS